MSDAGRRDALAAWLRFATAHSHVLRESPNLLFQSAANQPDNSSPAAAALAAWDEGRVGKPWFQWINKRGHHVRCLLTSTALAGPVFSCAYLPCGTRLIVGGKNGSIRILDAENGLEIFDLTGRHSGRVTCCACSVDGRRIASAAGDGTIRIWDAAAGTELLSIAEWSSSCAFDPSGRRLLSASTNGHLRVWDALDGRLILELEGHRNPTASGFRSPGHALCAWSPDGTRMVSARGEEPGFGDLRAWNAHDGTLLWKASEWGPPIRACCFSPDGRVVLCATADHTLKATVQLWDAETGTNIANAGAHASTASACAFSPDGRRFVSASYDKSLKVCNAADASDLTTLLGHVTAIVSCAFSPDGTRVVSGDGDGTIKIWDVTDAGEVEDAPPHTRAIRACACSPDGRQVVSLGSDRTIAIWSGRTGVIGAAMPEPDLVNESQHRRWRRAEPDADPDNRQAFRRWAIFQDGGLELQEEHITTLMSVAYSPDGATWVTGARTGDIKVWARSTGRELATLPAPAAVPHCVYSPDARYLAATAGGLIEIWNVDGWTTVARLEERSDVRPAFAPDGASLASMDHDRELRIWDVDRRSELDTWAGTRLLPSYVESNSAKILSAWDHDFVYRPPVVYAPDGRSVVSAVHHVLTAWSSRSGQPDCIFDAHEADVTACAISPDGRWVASASADGMIKVWHRETGVEHATFRIDAAVTTLATAAGGLTLIVGDKAGRLRLLRGIGLDLGPMIATARYMFRSVTREWDAMPTSRCGWCAAESVPAVSVLDAIAGITRANRLTPGQSACTSLPLESWSEPALCSECPRCRRAVRFNPFMLDNRYRGNPQ